MKVVMLCGGVGKRMFPITEDKFLLDFMGKTLLEYQIETARDAGLKDFVIIGNPGNIQQIKQIAMSISGAVFEFAIQTQPHGIADALKSASPLLNCEVVIVNPNDVFDGSAYAALLEAYRGGNASSYMLGYEVKEYFPGGYLEVDAEGKLTRIIEKPEPGTEPGHLVNILLHLHTDTRKLFEYMDIVRSTRDDVYEVAMDGMARHDYKIKVIGYNGFWAPIKYPWNLFDIIRYFLEKADSHIPPSASISDRAVIAGKVILGENVRILENAVVRGPVYIGPGSVIGNNSLVREYSHIGARCVVGFSTEIKGSYVGDDCWFHSSYIGDSVIGNNCSFGAGSVTANFRFDEKEVRIKYNNQLVNTGKNHFGAIIGDNCRTGINSGILPGRRMGPNSVIGSHVCLEKDLEPDTIVFNRIGHEYARHTLDLKRTTKTANQDKFGK